MPNTYPDHISLSQLDGTNGFEIPGKGPGTNTGLVVASAGDVNNDGYSDFIVTTFTADQSGETQVVFGHAGGFPAVLDLSGLNGSNGFTLHGELPGDHLGFLAAAAGDINGDGFDDVIVSSILADPHGTGSGAVYMVFGKAGGFAADINVSSLDGNNGFKMSGGAVYDEVGISVASAGDINGDGFADLVIGAPNASPNGDKSGAAYVVFGHAGGFPTNIDLAYLNGSNGFKVPGAVSYDGIGFDVAAAGDVNGDGLADFMIGTFGQGVSYVVFGKSSGFDASFDLADLDGTNGFRLHGSTANVTNVTEVTSAGDFNGDGFADMVVEETTVHLQARSYIVFGHAGGFSADVDIRDGIRLDGARLFTTGHQTVAAAGDVNGDGFADIIVGSDDGSPAGIHDGGLSYVVFGSATPPSGPIDLTALDGTNGFRIDGEYVAGRSGFSVSAAGDVNGDGFSDLMVGAPFADSNGTDSGSGYVIFGKAPQEAVQLSGTAASQTLSGGSFDDKLSGRVGDDHLFGNGGSDVLNGGQGQDTLIGGAGVDKLTGGTGNDTFVFRHVSDSGATGPTSDRITDFSAGDKIDLKGIEADAGVQFSFIGTDAFSHHAGEIRAFASGANTRIAIDIDGDRHIDFSVVLKGAHDLHETDFLL